METDNIILDTLIANTEISDLRRKLKYPGFISNFIEKRYRKRLLKSVMKIKKANIPLTRNNLFEYFSNIYNSQQGKYKSIKTIKLIDTDDHTLISALINIDKYKFIIKIDSRDENNLLLNISIKNEDKSFNNYNDISQKDLSGCINREVKEALSTLNRALWDELCDYLIEIIGTEAYAVKELKEYGK